MGIILGLIGLAVVIAVLVLSSARHGADRRNSIERYHQALDVLGEISEHGQSVGRVDLAASDPEAVTPPPTVGPLVPTVEPPGGARGIADGAPTTVFEFCDDGSASTQSGRVATRRAWPWSRSNEATWLQRSRRLLPVAVVAGLILVLVGVAVGLLSSSGLPRHSAAPPSRVSSGHHERASTVSRSTSTTTTSSTSTTTPSTTSSSTVVRSSSGSLELASLSPDAGTAGESVTLSGSGFFGAHGYVAVTFDGRVVPTRCPSEEICTAIVPDGLSGSVTVRLQTTSGKSNGLTFRYA